LSIIPGPGQISSFRSTVIYEIKNDTGYKVILLVVPNATAKKK